MFGVGFSEIVVIVVVALLVFGPDKLPEVARKVGKVMREFRRVSYDLQSSVNEAMAVDELRAARAAALTTIDTAVPGPATALSASDEAVVASVAQKSSGERQP